MKLLSRKLFYRIFVIAMLGFAIYYTNQSLQHWKKTPIVVSIDTRPINELAFPSVSICHSLSWMWPNIVNMLDYFDQEELVKDVIARHSIYDFKKYLRSRFKTAKTCLKTLLSMKMGQMIQWEKVTLTF